MDTNLEPPNPTAGDFLSPPSPSNDGYIGDSNCSTPYVSAPSSPGRSCFFHSAPASPMHFVLAAAASRSSATSLAPATSDASSNGSFEFEFSSRFNSPAPEIGPSMSSADELFLNGQIRPMKLCAHLQRPHEEDEDQKRSRDLRLRDRSQRRRTRSLSPLRSSTPFDWCSDDVVFASTPKKQPSEEKENGDGEGKTKNGREGEAETTASGSASSSRCSSAGRSSKRWVFLKDFLRSKSEGRSNNKFWNNISFSPAKENKKKEAPAKKSPSPAPTKRRSAHELHYAANRAQAEEMRKRTFLPYRQGLLGCLGFNSKSYGALNGFARSLNPVSST